MQNKKQSRVWIPLGEGLWRKGHTIYYRVQKNGKSNWLTTHTDHLPHARRWKEKHQRESWLRDYGVLSPESAKQQQPPLLCTALFDAYQAAGHPTVGRRGLKAKSPRSIRNESYLLTPLRRYFGKLDARKLGLADCDGYRHWRNSGRYVSEFKVRGRPVTKQTRGGDRGVDLELIVLSNALALAVRRGQLPANPVRDRGRYADPSQVRHCREVSPTPQGLVRIVRWFTRNEFSDYADLARFLAYTGLRLGEGLRMAWEDIDWKAEVIDVHRQKKGICPWALLLPPTAKLLRARRRRSKRHLVFASPFAPQTPLDDSSFRNRLARAARECGLPHVTPQGLRSYFVTQSRQSGLTDAEIAYLIGDRTGPTLIAQVYGDVRPEHLFAVARKIQVTARKPAR